MKPVRLCRVFVGFIFRSETDENIIFVKNLIMTKTASLALLFFTFLFNSIQAQLPKTDSLPNIMLKDSLLFSVGFNTCNIGQMEDVLSEHLEFYHDKGGFSDKKKFISDFRNGLCKDPATYQSRKSSGG
jgi:hypothetical protein